MGTHIFLWQRNSWASESTSSKGVKWVSTVKRVEFQKEPSFGPKNSPIACIISSSITSNICKLFASSHKLVKPQIRLILVSKIVAANQVASGSDYRVAELSKPVLKKEEHPQFSPLWKQKLAGEWDNRAETKTRPLWARSQGKRLANQRAIEHNHGPARK